MLIDWPTVIFQIINFLILIALLKRFLYGPVIRAMDDRERQVAARLARAAETEQAAAERAAALMREQENFVKTKEKMLLQAREEVEKWKTDVLVRLQSEVDEKRESWNSILVTEREIFLQKLKRLVSRSVFLIARKALADLADDELEARLINTFVSKINSKKDGVGLQLSPSMAQISCITGFPLSESQRQQLEKALSPYLGEGREGRKLIFKEDVDLGLGIRLLSDDQKSEWNVNRYMHELEKEIHRAMNTLTGADHGQ